MTTDEMLVLHFETFTHITGFRAMGQMMADRFEILDCL